MVFFAIGLQAALVLVTAYVVSFDRSNVALHFFDADKQFYY